MQKSKTHSHPKYHLFLHSVYRCWGKYIAKMKLKGEFLPPHRGKRTYLTKERTPLFWMLPGSQKAFFSFFFTSSLESSRSIFDSCRHKHIIRLKTGHKLQKWNVNTNADLFIFLFSLTNNMCETYFFWGAHLGTCQSWNHRVHQMGALGIAKSGQVLETNEMLQLHWIFH